jgi:hypothetical protein
MTQGSATTADICHPPGDGADSCTNANTHEKQCSAVFEHVYESYADREVTIYLRTR